MKPCFRKNVGELLEAQFLTFLLRVSVLKNGEVRGLVLICGQYQ
jgi:hypothetical protein